MVHGYGRLRRHSWRSRLPEIGAWRAGTASPLGAGFTVLTTAAYSTFLYQFDGVPGPSIAATQKYDSATDLWVSVNRIPTLRQTAGVGPSVGHAMAVTAGNLIFVMGGGPPILGSLYKNEAYSPITDTWATKTSMPDRHTGGGIGATSSKVHVASGWQNLLRLDIYDVATNSWTAGAPSCGLCFV